MLKDFSSGIKSSHADLARVELGAKNSRTGLVDHIFLILCKSISDLVIVDHSGINRELKSARNYPGFAPILTGMPVLGAECLRFFSLAEERCDKF